jgi:hypothetical protein
MEKKMVSLRLDEGLLQWATAYAESRGVSRTELLEGALLSFKAECETGVPDLKRRVREEREPRPGECSCPLLPGVRDGDPPIRGFRQGCEVHGRTREEFQQSVADRAALFRGLRAPLSVRGMKPREGKS